MPYIGKSPLHGNYQKLDSISSSFDGSTTQFALTTNSVALTPVTEAALIISINGVLQEPTTTYTVSGTNITFTSAPASTDTFFGVVLGEQLAIGTPSDSTITSAKLSGNLVTPGTLDVNGQELILDADADTTITADTDDQIDIKIAGADDFQFTANTFTVLSGSTLTIASGATIANSGTATGFSCADPSSADGDSLGTASAEWSDLYLADGGIIYFGNDQDVTVTHDPDDGLFLKSIATADDNPFLLTLQTGETDIAADDVIGKIAFQAPDEGTGTDAILVAAAIQARSEGDFSSSSNATSIDFMTGSSEVAAKKWTIKSDGKFEAAGAYTIDMNAGELILDANANTSITADTDDQIDFKVGGTDYFKFTTTQFGGVQGSASVPAVAWATDPDTGMFFGSNGSGQISFTGEGTERMRMTAVSSGAQVMIGDTASGNTDCGLTINQQAYDDHILTFKNSDVSVAAAQFSVEADTFGQFKKVSGTAGGLMMNGYSEGTTGSARYSWTATQPGTSPATSLTDVPLYNVAIIYESSDYAFDANAVIWGLRKTIAGGSGRMIAFFDEDGDLLLDGSSSNTAFDEEDDALLCRSFDLLRNPKQVIRSEFDKWTGDFKTSLEDAGILTKIDPDNPQHRNEDGTLGDPMVNVTQLQRLHNGAIWQQRAMFETMKQVADEMMPGFGTKLNERLAEKKLPALPVPA